MLATTDLELGFIKLINLYQLRWSIEVFFKETKQLLNLGKSQSLCFDGQIADITICFIQYTMLSFCKAISKNYTIGGVFKEICNGEQQNILVKNLQKIIWMFLDVLGESEGIDIIKLQEDLFRNPKIIELFKDMPGIDVKLSQFSQIA